MSTCLFMIKIRHLAYTCCHCLFFSTLDCVFFGLMADWVQMTWRLKSMLMQYMSMLRYSPFNP